jgi:hypothetical protein
MDDLYQRRAPRGYTKGPCPGCGEGTIYPKGSVCQNCRADLDRMAQIREEQKAKADERVYYTKERSYAFPYLPEEADRDDQRREAIREPLHRLHWLVSRPVPSGDYWKELQAREETGDAFTYTEGGYRDHDWRAVRIFPVAVADALRDLFAGIHASLERAHAEGHKKGRSLLMGLASGSITNDEFNNTAARIDKKVEEES